MVGLRGLEPLTKALLSYLLITRGYQLPPRHLLTTETTIMKKRIIDSMTAKQIADGCVAIINRVELEEYLESICKPAPSWEDDVAFNAVLCFVGNSMHQLERKTTMAYIYNLWTDPVYKYGAGDSCKWKLATPITPDDCWKPPAKPE